MSRFERLIDARGSIEGKVVATAMSALLVTTAWSTPAFAGETKAPGNQDTTISKEDMRPITLKVGETYRVSEEHISSVDSDNPAVATAKKDGGNAAIITAVGQGECVVTITHGNGVIEKIRVTVEPAVVAKHSVSYSWTGLPAGTYFNEDDTPASPTLPAAIDEVAEGDTYDVDGTYRNGTVLIEFDQYGNKIAWYKFSGWMLNNAGVSGEQTMGEADVALTGVWDRDPYTVKKWIVTYKFTGNVPEDVEAPASKKFINNQPFECTAGSYNKVEITDDYGNVTGIYTFKGWNVPDNLKTVTADVTIQGEWSFEPQEVAEHSVTYKFTGLPETFYDEDGNEVTLTAPRPLEGLVKNQPYDIDATEYPIVYDKDAYGNLAHSYTFTSWKVNEEVVSDQQTMGDENVLMEGYWKPVRIPATPLKITYSWTGDVPAGVTLPTDGTYYINNQDFTVADGYDPVYTYDTYDNLNGRYDFSGWNMESGKIHSNLTISGSWTFTEITVPAYSVNYVWEWADLPEGESLYSATGIKKSPAVPVDAKSYVKGQPYEIDANSYGATYYTHDDYGNNTAAYNFVGWSDPNDGTMVEGGVTITGTWKGVPLTVAKHAVTYEWSGLPKGETLYNGTGSVVNPKLPDSVEGLVKGQPYEIDGTNYTDVYTHDAYGNINGHYHFAGWNLSGEQTMGDADAKVQGEWKSLEVAEIPMWWISYEWTGDVPEGVTHLPRIFYFNNMPYTVDPYYPAGFTVDSHDQYGNYNGQYVFSGWDAENGYITSNMTITGSWKFEEAAVPAHNVTYSWTGLPEDVELFAATGSVVDPQLPATQAGLVKGQKYTVAGSYTPVYTHDTYGNVNGKYTFSNWNVTGIQTMGEANVEVTGVWTHEDVEVASNPVAYAYEGTVPAGAPDLPEVAEYVLNQPVTVADAPEYEGWIFSGWSSDVEFTEGEFDMPEAGVTITGSWTADVADLAVEGYEDEYDGEAHGVTVSGMLEKDEIVYTVDGEEVENAFVDVTEGTDVVVTVVRDGVEIWSGTATVIITPLPDVPEPEDPANPENPTEPSDDPTQNPTEPTTPVVPGTDDPTDNTPGTDNPTGQTPANPATPANPTTPAPTTPATITPLPQGDAPAAPAPAAPAPAAPAATIPDDNNPLAPAPADAPADAPAAPETNIPDNPTPQASAPTTSSAAEETIVDDKNALATFDPDQADADCWVHWFIMLGIALTVVYGAVVVARRLGECRDIDEFIDRTMGRDDRAQAKRPSVSAQTKSQPAMAEEA